MFKFDVINTILLIVGALNFISGVVIYLRSKNDRTSQLFFLVVLIVSFWVFSMIGFRGFTSEEVVLLWARVLYTSAAIIPFFFVYFAFVFPEKEYQLSMWQKYLLPAPLTFIIIISLYPKGLIGGVDVVARGEYKILFNQQLYFIYGLYIVSYFSFSYLILLKKYLVSGAENRVQLMYIISGTLISTMIGVVTNLLLPFFGNFELNWVGQATIIIMISAISYAIFKHHLFNIKVIATELLVFVVWIFLLVDALLAETWRTRVIDGTVLVFSVVFGVLIIRSVLKEVEQKDKFKELSEKLERANTQLKHKTLYLTTLQGFTGDIGKTLDFKQITQNIVDGISEKFGYLAGLLLLVSEDGKKISPVTITQNSITKIALGILPKQMHEYAGDFERDDTLSIRAVKENEIQQSNSIADFLNPPIPEMLCATIQKATGLRSGVAIPIRSEEKTIGTLDIFLNRPKEEIESDELEVMKTLANQISIVLKNASLFEQVKEANEKLKELDDLKTDFISIASHQLRTPLTAIKGYTSMIMEGSYGEVSDKVRETIGKVFQSAQRLIYIVNDLLDISRIEQGRFSIAPEQIKVANVLKDVVEELQQNAKNKNLSLELAVAPEYMEATGFADFNKIRQVFLNVIDNSIKYTDKGYVRVSVEQRPNDVLVAVKDSGIGISEASMKNLFQKFSRAKGVTKLHTDGSGLGLFIVKKIMEAHGGDVWAESEGEGKGSQFYISIPVQKG